MNIRAEAETCPPLSERLTQLAPTHSAYIAFHLTNGELCLSVYRFVFPKRKAAFWMLSIYTRFLHTSQ